MKLQAISNQLKRLSDRGIIERRQRRQSGLLSNCRPLVIDLLERGLWLTQDTKLRKEVESSHTAQREVAETLFQMAINFEIRVLRCADLEELAVAIRDCKSKERKQTMKAKVVALIASGLFAAGIWGYSQHMGPQNMQMMCPWMTQSDVQHMQKNPMMGWYAHMGQTRV